MPIHEKILDTHLIKTKPTQLRHIDDVDSYRLRKFILRKGQPVPVIINFKRELVDGELVLRTLKQLGKKTTRVLLLSSDNSITRSKAQITRSMIRRACRKVLGDQVIHCARQT